MPPPPETAPGPREPYRPLADRMRPQRLAELVGQRHLVGPGKALSRLAASGTLHSMILWGPPGTGKTTLARLIAAGSGARFAALSAVQAGIKDVRAVVEAALAARAEGDSTVLFLDEVHRFNKSQQDAFLPYVEDGTLVFVGATTENPSFEVNGALLSRARIYLMKSLEAGDLEALIDRALTDPERGLGRQGLVLEAGARELLARAADGDARRVLNFLEVAADLAEPIEGRPTIRLSAVEEIAAGGHRRFDKGGEVFYDQISALHKAVRGSHPDGALYWLCRMLDGGCDPLYVIRRAVRMASEDIGNADPRALPLVLSAWDAYDRLGSPEGELALAQAIVYLAVAPKSNATYRAYQAATAEAKEGGSLEVPVHLRNAPTRMMKDLGWGAGYQYDHDQPGGVATGQGYFPQALGERLYYHPAPRGLEIRIGEALNRLRAERAAAATQRKED